MELVKAAVPLERLASRLRLKRQASPAVELPNTARSVGFIASYHRLLREASAILEPEAGDFSTLEASPDAVDDLEGRLAGAGLDEGNPRR